MKLVELGTSLGVGVVDNVLVELEEQGTIKGNMTYVKDIIRIGGAVGGLVYNYAFARGGTEYDVSESLALSTLPLAIHSIRNLTKKFVLPYKPTYVLKPASQAPVQTTPSVTSRLVTY